MNEAWRAIPTAPRRYIANPKRRISECRFAHEPGLACRSLRRRPWIA